MNTRIRKLALLTCTGLILLSQQSQAAISLDRTRVIYPGNEKSITLSIHNSNTTLPYLAQSWLEDPAGKKENLPLIVVPPLQRVEPGAVSQVAVRALPVTHSLPQDRETLYYFNLREIPPKSTKPNTLQLALQTRVKFFYRPQSIQLTRAQMANPWQDRLTLTEQGGTYQVNNPTPYYITLVSADRVATNAPANGFKPLLVEPFGKMSLGVGAATLGNAPVLTYINDYGGSKAATFQCSAGACHVVKDENVR